MTVEPYEHYVDNVKGPDEYWEVMTRSGAPCVMMRKRVGEAEWARRAEIARAYLHDAFPQAKDNLYTTAYLGFGRKP